MNKEYFLRELERLLSKLPEEERAEAVQYYRDYFEEAGPEREAEILRELGSPEMAAAQILDGLDGRTDSGEFTERGYQDAHYGKDYRPVEPYEGDTDAKERQRRRRSGLLLILLAVFFGLPLAGTIISAGFSVVLAVLGGLLGVFGGLFALVFGGIATAIGLLAGGIGMVISGACNMMTPAIGTMAVGFGFFLLAAAVLLAAAAKWGLTTAVPNVIRFAVGLVRRMVGMICRITRSIFCRGGGRR